MPDYENVYGKEKKFRISEDDDKLFDFESWSYKKDMGWRNKIWPLETVCIFIPESLCAFGQVLWP